MGRRVGPTNKKERSSGFLDRFDGWSYVPSNFGWVGSAFRKIGIILLVALVAFLGFDFYRFGMTSQTFSINMTVKGNQYVPSSEVRTALQPILPGKKNQGSLLGVSASQAKQRIKQRIPRFKEVYVLRKFPNQLLVRVEERKPVAIVSRYSEEKNKRIFLPADREGVLFKAREEEWKRLKNTLPVVLGLEELPASSDGYERRWSRAMRVKQAFAKEFVVDMLNWIRIRPGGYATVQIERSRKLKVKLGLSNYHQKFVRLDRMMMTEDFQNINEYVNLRDLDQVLVN